MPFRISFIAALYYSLTLTRYSLIAPRYFLIVILSACLSGSLRAQVLVNPPKQFYVRIAGRIVSAESGKPVSYATVQNRQTRKAVVADSAGFYTIVLADRDTLEIRRVGYETRYYVKRRDKNGNYYEDIPLVESSLTLKEVTIYRKRPGLSTIALNPEFKREDRFRIQLFGPARGRAVAPEIYNPVSFLWEEFSREGRSRRKLAELLERKQINDLARIRYNEDYVQSLTGLKGRDLEDFMGSCAMPAEFVIKATDYELAAAVLNCYRRFMNSY